MIWERVKTWGLVALALVALVLLGQWQRARSLVKETKRDLAQKDAENKALREQRKREADLAAKKAANEQTLREHVEAIEARARSELAENEKRREEIRDAPDVDSLIAIGERMRKEGKIK